MNDFLNNIATKYGTPCFVYFFEKILKRIKEIECSLGKNFKISYAVKANPNPGIVKRLNEKIPFLDVSSSGELKIALNAGWDRRKISFTGPGKTDQELIYAIENSIGEIVVESINEAIKVSRFATQNDVKQNILIRISPAKVPRGFGGQMAGQPSAFGIDEEDLSGSISKISKLTGIKLTGFHIFSGTQCLDEEAIVENWKIFIEKFMTATLLSGLRPTKLIFGSGIGIPYYQNEKEIDLNKLAEISNPTLEQFKNEEPFRNSTIVLETGRYLVGQAGIYMTKVINIKVSRGLKICICDGGMNHNLAACGLLGMVMPRNYRIVKVKSQSASTEIEKVQLVGPLCTTLDTFGRNVDISKIEIGDIIGILNTGAYGLTSSPMEFISHSIPKEFILEKSDNRPLVEDVTRKDIELNK